MNNTNNINYINKLNKYLNYIDIIYWINLDRSTERRKNMENILKYIKISNIRISASDGKILSYDKIYNRFRNINDEQSKIEYACLLSHFDTIKTFMNSHYNNALILEDDITLEYLKFWNKTLCEIIQKAPYDWEIIMLNYVSQKKLKDLYTLNLNGQISCCQAYIINKKGANKLMNQLYLKDDIYTLNKSYKYTADDYIFSCLKTYVYKYPYFTYPIENTSTIHSWQIDYHNYTKILCLLQWKDFYNFSLSSKYKKILNYRKKYIIYLIIILLIIIIYIKYRNINKSTKNHKNRLIYV